MGAVFCFGDVDDTVDAESNYVPTGFDSAVVMVDLDLYSPDNNAQLIQHLPSSTPTLRVNYLKSTKPPRTMQGIKSYLSRAHVTRQGTRWASAGVQLLVSTYESSSKLHFREIRHGRRRRQPSFPQSARLIKS